MKVEYLKKIGFRFLVVNIVFFIIKLTIDHGDNEEFINNDTLFYYGSAIVLFILTWEVNDWLIKQDKPSSISHSLDVAQSLKVLSITVVIVSFMAAIIYYLAIFKFDSLCDIHADDPWLQFRVDFFRAVLLGVTLSILNQFYHISKEKKEMEISMYKLKKEMTASRYSSLKNQISPHFLFNSLNTLTSLMYEDRDLASDFVSRLASCYRYILDNREKDLVTLEKELQFLDSFIFMMKVRHDGAISIKTNINKEHYRKLIPTLTLQMLVENALKHNYYSKEHPIIIEIYTEVDRLIVKNNLKKRPEDIQESTQLGLSNIKKRYSFYTNEAIIVENDDAIFKVSMPLLSDDPNGNIGLSLTV